ncbi:MAG: hypothetical protein WBV61_13355 [Rhodanobacteraceae bacterium]
MHRPIFATVMLLTATLAACATTSTQSRETLLDNTLESYAATLRWGNFADARQFLAPKYRKAHPLSPLDLARYRQVQVSWYHDSPAVPVNAMEVTQTVEIGLVNVNTQAARSIVDHQVWRYDEAAKHWWLMSGLPDITHHE